MKTLTIRTNQPKQVIDITDEVNKFVVASTSACQLFVTHTTCALTTADLDPGTDLDMLEAFEAMIPKLNYRHPHDPEHVPDHILSAIIGPSLMIPVNKEKLILGTWQRVVLIELNGPRERQILVNPL